MNIQDLICKINNGLYENDQSPVTVFCGKEYSQLFFPFFLNRFAKITNKSIERIDLIESNREYVKSKLNVSFLGQKAYYWISNISAMSASDKRYWLSYLKEYNGPNSVLFFVQTQDNCFDGYIDLDDILDQKKLIHVISFLYPKRFVNANSLILKTLPYLKKYSLDNVILLAYYGMFLGGKTKEFISDWLLKIIPQSSSLFTLSQNLFAKKRQAFIKQMAILLHIWPPLFWVSFWSEQLWRASMYVNLMNKKQFAEAKKISYKLPFSFINYDWKRYSFEELKKAHQLLYAIDYDIKNGGQEYAIDVFYFKFLLNEFV